MTAPRPEDRRQFGRIHLDAPIRARVGEAHVNLTDVSVNGVRVASDARFTHAASVALKFEWKEAAFDAMCRVIRCTLAQFAKAPGEKSIYQTGLHIVETIGDSDRVLREMIGAHVLRALEEQIANARGIPPVESLLRVEGNTDRYRRCELTDGKWRRFETTQTLQPASGFTISAGVPLQSVALLCATYEKSNEEGRRLTRILAQLSVTRGEGVPTRRYVP